MKARLAALPAWQRTGLAVATGALSTFAFAPYDFWPMMVPAFALLLWLVDGASSWRGALLFGWALSFGQLVVGLDWISVAFRYQAQMPPIIGHLAVLLLAVGMAFFAGAATAIARCFWRPTPDRVCLLGLCWMGGEWLRGHVLTGFPWNLIGSLWANWLPLAQGASFIGVYGLTLLTVIWCATAGLLADRDKVRPVVLLLAGSFGLAYGLGSWRLSQNPERFNSSVQVHIVQTNIGQEEKWQEGGASPIFARYMQLSAEAIAAHGPGIIIWPETAIPPFAGRTAEGRSVIESFTDDPATRAYVAGKLLRQGGYLLAGVDQFAYDNEGTIARAYNSMIAIDAHGQSVGRYDKVHLVPFGEYLPARPVLQWLGLDKLAAGAIDFSSGTGPAVLHLADVPPFAPIICYEAIFTGAVVSTHGRRPAWILNISNDAWFGTSSGPHQHLAQARLRAIEEGLPVVRSTPTGISTIIDPLGRLVAQLPPGHAQVLSHYLPRPIATTLYGKFHNGTLVILVLVVSLLILRSRQKRRAQL